MAIRDDILANVTTALTGSNVSVSSQLPWSSGDVPLYQKNMKKFYLSEASQEITPLQATLGSDDVYQTESILTGYITVDAKNQPGDINTIISGVLNSKNSVVNQFRRECFGSTEIEDDRITYIFEYRFVKVN